MTKKTGKKYYYAKAKAVISIQFYVDKEGTPNISLTCNEQKEDEDWFPTGPNGQLFGYFLAENKLLDLEDHDLLEETFKYYLKRRAALQEHQDD